MKRPMAAGVPRLSTLRAVLLVVLSAFCFAIGHAGAKYLSDDLHPFVIAFWRNFMGLLPFLPWMARNWAVGMHTNRFSLHVMRAFVSAATVLLWFSALALMPLADATALSMLGPLFAMLFAGLFLSERVEPRRWAAIAFGMLGALAIIRPGFEAVGLGAILVLCRGLCQGVDKVMAKSLTRTDEPRAIVAWVMLLMTPITLAFAVFFWKWPNLAQLALLTGIGLAGSLANICMVTAYREIDVSMVEPITFTRMIWAAVLGYVIFAEFPDLWVWIGGAMIVAATSYIARREATRKRVE
ncbi:MAG: drug/metabolite transporter (DMT)-like permease [Alphaproteobacteria bacterium]|jgi:drug/metabolite transporter (DMT)-like permease